MSFNPRNKGDDEEHQLGRVNLSGDGNAVEFIETDDSEDNDLSDDEAHHMKRPTLTSSRGRNVRRTTSLKEKPGKAKGPPNRAASTSFSRRFRRSSKASTSADLWKSRDAASDVDQTVNLMDLSQSNPGSASHARPGMSSLRQKSLVDIFLADDSPTDQYKNQRGSDVSKRGNNYNKKRTCRTWVLVASVVVVAIVIMVLVPNFGLVSSVMGDKDAPKAPTKPPTSKPTSAPTKAPAKVQEEVIEEEEVELPPKEEEENDVPQENKLEALEFFVVDLHISDQKELDKAGSPANKALHWLSEEDPAKLPIPGSTGVETADVEAEEALLQRYALAVFYYSMQESSTTNENRDAGRLLQAEEALANRREFDQTWLSAQPICMWHGVVCDEDDHSVTEINLPGHYLQGTLPKELFVGEAMPFLKQLDLSGNQLQGTLPRVTQERENSRPFALEVLNLSNNHLKGKFPAESLLGKLTGLKSLKLLANEFSGTLPDTFHNLIHLQELMLTGNWFSGSIPKSFGDLGNLRILYLDGNLIEGEVPSELGRLVVLQEFQLDGNDVTGTMPQEVCDLRDHKLSDLESDCASDQFICDCCTECW